MKVLELLASRPGEVFSPTQIEESAWPDVVVSPNSVYQSIAHLRRALGDDKKEPRFIETISRKGYRCVGRVEPIEVCPQSKAASVPLVQAPVEAEAKRRPKVNVTTAMLILLLLAVGVGMLSFAFTPSKRENETLVSGLPVHDGPANITAETLLNAGDLALIGGRIQEAAQHFERALTLARKGGGEPLIAQAMAKLADAYLWQAKYEQAAGLGAESVRMLEQSTPPMDPTQINSRIVLGEALIHLDKYHEAETHLLRAIDLSQLLYGSSSPRTEGARSTLIKLRVAEGRLVEAEELTRDLLAGPPQKDITG